MTCSPVCRAFQHCSWCKVNKGTWHSKSHCAMYRSHNKDDVSHFRAHVKEVGQ